MLGANVHTPVFDFEVNEITVSEGAALNADLLTLTAVDQVRRGRRKGPFLCTRCSSVAL